MTTREIIDVQLESIFGDKLPQKIQQLVDEELNQGRWVDGYDLAVCQGVIGRDDAGKLLEIVISQHPHLRLAGAELRAVVDKRLPQSRDGFVSWIVDYNGSYAMTDTVRVARFDGASIAWRSPRISFDGIDFDSLSDGKLRGRAWLGSDGDPDVPFVFDFETGEMLEGFVVEHE